MAPAGRHYDYTDVDQRLTYAAATANPVQRAVFFLAEGDTAWNPNNTRRDLAGPGRLEYIRYPGGDISVILSGPNDLDTILAAVSDLLAQDDASTAASARRLSSAFKYGDEPTPTPARPRRRLGVLRLVHGSECEECYEDVPDSESAEGAE